MVAYLVGGGPVLGFFGLGTHLEEEINGTAEGLLALGTSCCGFELQTEDIYGPCAEELLEGGGYFGGDAGFAVS